MQAPVVAHGHDLVYWDSNNARALVNARGMEYQNHWGAHDPDVELPSEQLNAFFGTRAEYWTPSAKPSALRGQPQQQPPGQGKQPAGSPPGIPGHQAGSSERQTSVPTAAIQGSSVTGNERAQRAADRAHNEAVIASTDQQVAQALADEEAQVSRHSRLILFVACLASVCLVWNACCSFSCCMTAYSAKTSRFVSTKHS